MRYDLEKAETRIARRLIARFFQCARIEPLRYDSQTFASCRNRPRWNLRWSPACGASRRPPRSVLIMDSTRRSIFRAGVVDLGVETVTLPNGLTVDLPVIRHPGAAAIVALDRDHRV